MRVTLAECHSKCRDTSCCVRPAASRHRLSSAPSRRRRSVGPSISDTWTPYGPDGVDITTAPSRSPHIIHDRDSAKIKTLRGLNKKSSTSCIDLGVGYMMLRTSSSVLFPTFLGKRSLELASKGRGRSVG